MAPQLIWEGGGAGNLTLGVLLVFVFPIAAVLGDVGCDCLKLGH